MGVEMDKPQNLPTFVGDFTDYMSEACQKHVEYVI
jgi:hypothetical protein